MQSYDAKREAKKQKLPAYLKEDEFVKLIKLVKKEKHKLAFNLAFCAGLRISEVVKLQPENIDIASKRIFIKDSKYGRDRVVPLPKGFPEKYLKHIPVQISIRGLQAIFKKKVLEAGLNPELHFHSLRHSFAVNCMEKGIPLNHIQVLLGHENISTTSIYLKINPKDALESYEKFWTLG